MKEKNRMLKSLFFANFLMFTLTYSPFVQAFDEDEELLGYDAILNELQNPKPANGGRSQASSSKFSGQDPFDSIMLHAGVGFTAYTANLVYPDGNHTLLNQRGVQAALGIDLFSQHLMAEGIARSFTPLNYEGPKGDKTHVTLQEFELRFLYKNRLASQLGFKAGVGLAARYMTVERQNFGKGDYTTPASVAVLGTDLFINETFSLGAEVCARSALISDTMDQGAYDATLRLDTHF